jgi:Na+-driven multidrug efflux pump
MLGVSAGVLAASLSIAYAIVGFAVLHMITRGMGSRPFTLGSTYVAVLILGWPVLVMSLLGLADTAFDLRGRGGRAGRRHGPSDPQT